MNRQEMVSRALSTNVGTSPRSEDLGSYPDFFVDPINSTILESNTNQLIFGRRGSGKTLMLGTINDRIRERFPKHSVISFCYTATDFRSSAEFENQAPSVKERTHAFFHAFIESLCHDIFDLADQIMRKPSWLDYLKLSGSDNGARRDRLVTAALELLEVSRHGTEAPLPTTTARTTKENTSINKGSKRSVNFNAGAKLTGTNPMAGASAGAAFGQSRQTSSEKREETTYSPRRQFSPAKVKELLVEIVEALELDCIIIFIDEWMSLAECQVEFAERLRRALFGDKRIAVKIAADQYQGQFDNSGHGHNFRGLEIGADIFVAVDLDHPFRDPDKKIDLFSEALYRRLYHFEPELERFFGQPPLTNPDRFVDTIFSSKQAFRELCAGAQGICRDFHLLFQECSKRIDSDLSNGRIDFETVRKVILDSTEQTYGRVANSLESNTLLFRVISPHIQSTGSRYFILESKPGPSRALINDLLTKRIIHSIPSASLHPSIRGEFDCFEIQYGLYLDLMRAAEFATGQKVDDASDPAEVAAITSHNKATFLLDLSGIGTEQDNSAQRLLCPHCEEEFLSSARAYQVRGICPHCFLDQDHEKVGETA